MLETIERIHERDALSTNEPRRFRRDSPLNYNAGDSNLYRYVRNAFPNSVDPSGLQEIKRYTLGIEDAYATPVVTGQHGIFSWPIRWTLSPQPPAKANGAILQEINISFEIEDLERSKIYTGTPGNFASFPPGMTKNGKLISFEYLESWPTTGGVISWNRPDGGTRLTPPQLNGQVVHDNFSIEIHPLGIANPAKSRGWIRWQSKATYYETNYLTGVEYRNFFVLGKRGGGYSIGAGNLDCFPYQNPILPRPKLPPKYTKGNAANAFFTALEELEKGYLGNVKMPIYQVTGKSNTVYRNVIVVWDDREVIDGKSGPSHVRILVDSDSESE